MYVVSEGGLMLCATCLRRVQLCIDAGDVVTTGGDHTVFSDWDQYGAWNYDYIFPTFLEHLGVFIDFPAQIGDDFTSTELRIMEPYEFGYNFQEDYRLFGSTLGLIPNALRIVRDALDGSNALPLVLGNEKQVRHTTASGSCVAPGGTHFGNESDQWRFHPNISFRQWNANGAPYLFDSHRVSQAYLNDFWPVILQPQDYLGKVQTHIQGNPTLGGPWWWYGSGLKLRLLSVPYFNFEVEGHSLTLSYAQRVHFGPDDLSWYVKSTFHTSIEIKKADFVDPSGTLVFGLVTRKDVVSDRDANVTGGWGTPGTRSFSGEMPAVGRYVHTSFAVPSLESMARGHVLRIQSQTDLLMDEIRKSAYVSVGDALIGYEDVIQSNYFESIAELRNILSLVPDLGPLNLLIKAVGAGNILTGALTFVDVVTNVYLLYKFGLQPLASDLKGLAENLDEFVRRYNNRSESAEMRGKFTFTFPSGDPLEGSTLVTRSKLVFNIPKKCILAMMLSFRSGGLDVAPHSAWDLVPFSFVVDWFANIDDRMEMGFNHLRFLSIEMTTCVHSFTVYTPLKDTLLLQFSDEAQVKHYERLVSGFLPAPKDGRYDFLSNHNGPPLASAGSLLWTVAR
jgi:hypothetical protein